MADFSAYKQTFTAPLVNTTGTITITQATTSTDGYLSSTDWNTFNGKVTNPMTTAGDVIYGGASGVPTRLAVSTDGYVLTLASGVPAWVESTSGKLIVEDLGFGLDNGSSGRGTINTRAVSLEYSPTGSTFGATGLQAHTEGLSTTGSGGNAHAEGNTTIASGNNSHAEGTTTTASGGSAHSEGSSSLASHVNEHSHASGQFGEIGDCQNGKVQARNVTSSTGEVELFLDGIDDQFTLEDNDAYTFHITVFGAQEDGSIGEAIYQIKINRQGATTSLSQSLQTILAWNGDANIGTPTWAITADDTNDSLKITVTPANTTATRWTALLEYVKINY